MIIRCIIAFNDTDTKCSNSMQMPFSHFTSNIDNAINLTYNMRKKVINVVFINCHQFW